MKTYLSIDIDYWMASESDPRQMVTYLRKAIRSSENVQAVITHDQMLSHVNSLSDETRTLINVDYHSDLGDFIKGDRRDYEFNEGTWVNYVKFSPSGFFRWHYPEDQCAKDRKLGRCEAELNPFVRKPLEVCGWQKVSLRKQRIPTPQKLDLSGVGICISPDWIDRPLGFRALKILLQEKIIDLKFCKKAIREILLRSFFSKRHLLESKQYHFPEYDEADYETQLDIVENKKRMNALVEKAILTL